MTTTESTSTKLNVAANDFILYKTGTLTQLGKVTSVTDDNQIIVEQHDDTLQLCGDDDVITSDQIICNFYAKPMEGFVYGRMFTQAPKKISMEGHEVYLYIPKEFTEDGKQLDSTALIDQLQIAFDTIEPLKQAFCDKQYEIHIREGETHKSSFKKSKKDLDGNIALEIRYAVPETILPAMIGAFSQILWKQSARENRSDWLKAFSEDLVFERLDNSTFTEKFIQFIKEESPKDLEPEDEIICKLLVKEIKRVKCLSLKELRLLADTISEDYIVRELLPEVINSVRLKGGARINPLTSTTALKKFSSELTSLVINQRCDPHFESIIRLFFD